VQFEGRFVAMTMLMITISPGVGSDMHKPGFSISSNLPMFMQHYLSPNLLYTELTRG